MYEVYQKRIDGSERNVSEEIGYLSNEDNAKMTADTFQRGALFREVDEVYMASQNFLYRMRGGK